jgi:hypothetical protein
MTIKNNINSYIYLLISTMKRYILILTILAMSAVKAQEHAWVYFVDKPNEVTFLANPLTMLSQRALDRRTIQNIALDAQDVPISNAYINQIDSQVGVEVKAKSKWLNAVHVFGSEIDINNLSSLPIVSSIEFASNSLSRMVRTNEPKFVTNLNRINYNYGGSANQVEQIGVDFLHQNNFTGTGLQIAVLDAGFPNVDNLAAFQQIRDNNQILGGYNYVVRSSNFYTSSSHGTSVLSTMAGFVDNEIVGTAPDAKYYLFITEDINSETPLEESLWVEAAEKVDSLGVDVINTSLGYQDFNEAKYDHSYSDMDGNTTFIARGANIAVSRGMIVVVAAGNDGNSTTYNNIATPADATNVFTVGAVNSIGDIASFSSFGPSFDNRIKPDVDAKGLQTTIVNVTGNVVTGNGTSFASPIMAGAVASFWQAFPNKTNTEIMQLVRESAHLYNNPTNQEGYGIPNFRQAYLTASENDFEFQLTSIYPNPAQNEVFLNLPNDLLNANLTIFDFLGKLVFQKPINTNTTSINISQLAKGIYLLNIDNNQGENKVFKIIKN